MDLLNGIASPGVPLIDSPDGAYLGGQNSRVDRPGVAYGAQNGGFAKSGGSEFLEEGTAFFSARYSGKPVGLTGSVSPRERLPQDQLGCEYLTTRP